MPTNAQTKWMIYKELELIPDWVPEPKRTYPQPALSWLTGIWQKLVHGMAHGVAPSGEPKVWQTIDDDGSLWWNIYDPLSAHTFYMSSEAEVISWLDEYYGPG